VIIRRVHPGVDAPLDLPAQQHRLDALYAAARPEWLRLNLVSSIDGSVAGVDGTSQTLTRGADRRVLGAIRRASDLVLVGASSFRGEGYLLPKAVPLAVVTATGDLTGHGMPAAVESGRLLVLCPRSAVDTVRRTLAVTGADIIELEDDGTATPIDPAAMVATLRDRGLRSIVCEGGPVLAGRLVAAGLVDELCLSTSPTIGGPTLQMLGGVDLDPVALELRQLLVDDSGVSYARWTLPDRRSSRGRTATT
jgi:riboflavin biosynthesis pyrimidine reductase